MLAADDAILGRLDAVRDRLLRRARLLRAASTVSLVVGSAISLATVRMLAPAFELRMATLLVGLSTLVGLVVSARSLRRRLLPRAVAEALHDEDRRTGTIPIADELRSFLELRTAGRADAFLLIVGDRVTAALDRLDLERALPLAEARRTLWRSLLVALSAVSLVGLMAPRLWPDAWHALRHGVPVDSGPPPAPIVGDLELELTPPAYTGLPTRTLPSSGGELRALKGTQVHLRARSLGRTLRAALILELEGQKAKRVPVTLESSTAAAPLLETDFTVDAPGRYRFLLWRWTGRLLEPEAHRIELDPDLPPRVELRVPADPLELAAPRPIELAIDIEDDFGLGAISLVYQVGGAKPVKKPLTLEQPTPRRARGRYVWETGELERDAQLPAGAKITYWIEAEDNDAVSGKKTGRSRTATLLLRTPVKPADVDRATLEALVEATLLHLADRLEKVTSPEPHGALVALLARFQKAAQGSPATAALKKVATDAAARLDKLAAEEATRGAASADAIVAELERDVLALDDLRARRRLDEMVRLGNDMKRAKDELSRLMTELKTATTDAQKALLKQEIERKLVELEAKMAELRRASQDAEGEVPDEFLNKDALQKAQMKNQTDSIRDMLQKGDLDKAMSELDRMSRSLDQLTKSLERGQHDQRQAGDPAADKAMAALENDLADLSKEEREVEAKARQIREQAADKAAAQGGGMKALRDKLKSKLAELDQKAEEQSHEGRLVDREDVERMRARAKSIDKALEAEDLDEAQDMASATRRLAQGMSVQLHQMVEEMEAEAQARVGDGPTPSLRRSDRHAAEIEQLARQVEAELNKSENQRQPSLGGEAKKQLDELARRQQSLQQKSDALKQRLGQDPGLQGTPQGVGQKLDGARQQMSESGRQLQRPAPGRGAESAGQAADQLDAARKQVADARKGGGESGEGDSSDNQRDEPVRIPGADDSAAPRAFREELLDAMKRGAPKRFEEQVQHFYEELVR